MKYKITGIQLIMVSMNVNFKQTSFTSFYIFRAEKQQKLLKNWYIEVAQIENYTNWNIEKIISFLFVHFCIQDVEKNYKKLVYLCTLANLTKHKILHH